MTSKSREGIVFQVETSRILEILASEIYDSPHALLRENVQNAYDAILMRADAGEMPLAQGRIAVQIDPRRLTIRDNGLGMDEDVLRNNFWKAGSSGKRTEAARRAGVVGTFGIGAMANFGVANSVQVQTRLAGQDVVLRSSALREDLSIQEECIRLEEVEDEQFETGTLITVLLDEGNPLNVSSALSYLRSYVHFLPVQVICNGENISQQEWQTPAEAADTELLGACAIETEQAQAALEVFAFSHGARLIVRVSNLTYQGASGGAGLLVQDKPPLMGFRNFFGLAPIPTSGHFSFGGFINALFLQPTAGREALSRDSIQSVTSILHGVEHAVSELVAGTYVADANQAFQQRAIGGPVQWARRVSVRLAPTDQRVELRDLWGRDVRYYPGRDRDLIQRFSSESTPLVVLDQNNPRRRLQQRYISDVLRLEQIPDRIQVEIVPGAELQYQEATFLLRATTILLEEYLVDDVEVLLADLSHGVDVLVQTQPGLRVLLSRNHRHLSAVLQAYETAPDAFGGLVRDFIRTHIYSKISAHVPSATQQGAEALIARSRRTRELFKYDEDELGSLEPLLSDLLSGDATVGEVIRRAGRTKPQAQRVTHSQVGSVETEFPDVIHDNIAVDEQGLDPAPPILRPELKTEKKILISANKHPSLNGFGMLLGLSDRLSRTERPFFESPHQTRVMWAQHRIVYVFTHAAGELSMYYDIEMPEPQLAAGQGGLQLPTTTLVTKSRIFVPVPDVLESSFELVDGERKFHVRFATLSA